MKRREGFSTTPPDSLDDLVHLAGRSGFDSSDAAKTFTEDRLSREGSSDSWDAPSEDEAMEVIFEEDAPANAATQILENVRHTVDQDLVRSNSLDSIGLGLVAERRERLEADVRVAASDFASSLDVLESLDPNRKKTSQKEDPSWLTEENGGILPLKKPKEQFVMPQAEEVETELEAEVDPSLLELEEGPVKVIPTIRHRAETPPPVPPKPEDPIKEVEMSFANKGIREKLGSWGKKAFTALIRPVTWPSEKLYSFGERNILGLYDRHKQSRWFGGGMNKLYNSYRAERNNRGLMGRNVAQLEYNNRLSAEKVTALEGNVDAMNKNIKLAQSQLGATGSKEAESQFSFQKKQLEEAVREERRKQKETKQKLDKVKAQIESYKQRQEAQAKKLLEAIGHGLAPLERELTKLGSKEAALRHSIGLFEAKIRKHGSIISERQELAKENPIAARIWTPLIKPLEKELQNGIYALEQKQKEKVALDIKIGPIKERLRPWQDMRDKFMKEMKEQGIAADVSI